MIICDTLIWYKNIPEKIKEEHELAATILSMIELYKSSDRREGVIISVWERFSNNSAVKILFFPDQHFHWLTHRGEIIHFDIMQSQLETANRYGLIIRKAQKRGLTDLEWNLLHAESQRVRNDFNNRFNRFANFINDYRKQKIKNKETDNYFRTSNGVEDHLYQVTMPLILTLLTGVSYTSVSHDEISKFLEIELFTHVFNRWLLDLDIEGETATTNDVIDIFNMIYVQRKDKYWTEEKKWLKKIDKAGMSHYIFDPDL